MVKKILKIILYSILGVLLLVAGVVVFLLTPPGQRFVTKHTVSYLSQKLQTPFSVGKIRYRLPTSVGIDDLLLIDRNADTLAYLHYLDLNVNMWDLLSSKISVRSLEIADADFYMHRQRPDTFFNYQYIIDAFAGDPAAAAPADTAKAEKKGNPLKIDVVKTALKNVRFRFHDESGGTDFSLFVKDLLLKPSNIDIEQLRFDVDELSISGVRVNLVMTESILPPAPDTSTGTSPLLLSIQKLHLKDAEYTMDAKTSAMYMKANVGELDAKVPLFDLAGQLMQADKLYLSESNVLMVMGKSSPVQVPEVVPEVAEVIDTLGWRIVASDVKLKNIGYQMDDNKQPPKPYGMDYAHMDIRNLFLVADDLVYTNDTISGNVRQLALKEKSGLELQEFKTSFVYHSQGALLEDFLLKTPETLLQHKLGVSYTSLDALSSQLGLMGLDIELKDSRVGINDVLLFAPDDLRKQLMAYKNQHLMLASDLKGTLGALNIRDLYLEGLKDTRVKMNGTVIGLPNADKLQYILNIAQLQTSSNDLDPFLPDSLKMQVNLPARMAVNGKVRGGIYNYEPQLTIITSDGNAHVSGFLNLKPEGQEKYDLVVNAQQLNIGKVIRQDSVLGIISSNIKVNGSSFDVKRMQTTLDLDVLNAYAMGYNYNSITGTVVLNNGRAQASVRSTDPNLYLTLDGNADLSNLHPDINALLDIRNADLHALKLSQDTLKVAGLLEAHLPVLNVDYPQGTIIGSEIEVSIPGNKLPLDSIKIFANSQPETGQDISMDIAKLLNLNVTGTIPLTQIGNGYMYHINKFYNLGDTFEYASDYTLDLDGVIRYNPILTRFNRSIKPFDTIGLHSALSRETMDLAVNIPYFRYGNHVIDSGFVSLQEDNDRINYNVGARQYRNKDELVFFYPGLNGRVLNDTVYARAVMKDSGANNRFVLGFAVNKDLRDENSLTHLRLFRGLMIDYDLWQVNENNRITLGSEGFLIKDFFISQQDQRIGINSIRDEFNSPLAVNIDNFRLGSVTKILNPDTLPADGVLNTNVEVDLNPPIPFIKGNASITGLEVFRTPLGNVNLIAETEDENTYHATLTVEGNGNNVKLDGDYYIAPKGGNNFDFDLGITPLALKSVEGLTFGSLRNSSGTIEGQLKINGTFDKPLIRGNLVTNDLKTTVVMLGGSFTLPQEKIAFNDRGIELQKVRINDYQGRSAVVDGRIATRNFKDYFLNLNFAADRWSPVNSRSRDYEMFYGKLVMSSNIDVKGYMQAPNISGNLTIHDSTNLTFALLDSDPQLVETEGIVEFYDSRYPRIEWDVDSVDNVLKRVRFSQTAQMNVNVGIEKYAKFDLVIDPSTGDNLMVNGEASLNAQIAPNGSIGLAGTYALEDGYYELSFPPVRRKFRIQKGSTISLAGDPLDATVDITAIFDANVAPYDLVERQISDPAQLVYYKQRLPFDVVLKLNGNAMSPNIAFDIVLPEGETSVSSDVTNTVQAKLASMRNNPSEMNKQVFAVIVLKRFVTEESFGSGGGMNVEYIARQSVSRFLSSQLNSLAGQFISGFDLNMDLESSEDYTTGDKVNRTDLNVSVSKSLFNDRLSVSVGNDFLLEGGQNAGGRSSGIPGNFSADYRLTEDGRYILRGYRRNELQNLIDGYVVETGLGFRYSLQYNRFRYLFMSNAKRRERFRQMMEQQRRETEELQRKTDAQTTSNPAEGSNKEAVLVYPATVPSSNEKRRVLH